MIKYLIFIILLWLHHLTFSVAFSLTFGKKNGANVISNDIKPTKIQNEQDIFELLILPILICHWPIYIIMGSIINTPAWWMLNLIMITTLSSFIHICGLWKMKTDGAFEPESDSDWFFVLINSESCPSYFIATNMSSRECF